MFSKIARSNQEGGASTVSTIVAMLRRIPTKYLLIGLAALIFVILVLLLHSSHRLPKHGAWTNVFGSDRVYTIYDTSKYINKEGRIFVPSDAILNSMSHAELEELFFRYQETIEIICPRQRHIGDELDGGYHACETGMPKEGCLVYSFGNRKDYSLDDGLAFYYKCEVHSFDPDDTQVDHQHAESVYFHKYGIGGKNEIVNGILNIKTFDTLRTLLHHDNRQVNLLKIDAEGAEWASLKQMLEVKSFQRANITMLVIEFHTIFYPRTADEYRSWLQTLRGLYEAGFRRYFFRMWHGGCMFTNRQTGIRRTGCHETHFMRIN